MMLSVIIPCFNEVNTIETIIQNISYSSVSAKEIIIVDDGSTDGSRDFLSNISVNENWEDPFKIINKRYKK